ncbi:MAG: hypothetical protein ACP5RT_00905 [Candidatus Micrarchaeia archaeon]
MEDGLAENRFEVAYMTKENADKRMIIQNNIFELIIKKSKNGNEYKKYSELVGMLILKYYKRLGSINAAINATYEVIEESGSINDLIAHYNALKEEEKSNVDVSTDNARSKIANMLLNDYKRRFGEGKKDAYNVLVLQSWVGKVENINELTILMDNILTIRDKLGNSWDYEVHIIPLLIEKAFTTEDLIDYTNSITNLIIGLSKKLNDSYLAVMTGVKVLEYATSPNTIKFYIRDMIKENNKKVEDLNNELATLNSNKLSKVKNLIKIKNMNNEVINTHVLNEELMRGFDPKEFMLGETKR